MNELDGHTLSSLGVVSSGPRCYVEGIDYLCILGLLGPFVLLACTAGFLVSHVIDYISHNQTYPGGIPDNRE